MTLILWGVAIYIVTLLFLSAMFSLLYWYEATNNPCPQIPPPAYTARNVLCTISRFFYSHAIRPFIALAWACTNKKQPNSSPYPAVILIHGIFCTRAAWHCMHRALFRRNFHVREFAYRTMWGSMDETVERLEEFVRTVRKEANSPKVIIVGHSLGGVVARYWLAKYPHNADHITTLVTLCTPHQGSNISMLLANPFSRALAPDSEIIASIAQQPYDQFPCVAYVTNTDLLVTPACRLLPPESWQVKVIPAVDHLEFLSNTKAVQQVADDIQNLFP